MNAENTQTVHPAETEQSVATYDQYREICDAHANNFRLTGIVSEEGYQTAVSDPETAYVQRGGISIPAVVAMEHVEGYDEEKCKALSGKKSVRVLALAPAVLRELSVSAAELPAVAEDQVVVVESGYQEYEFDKRAVPQLLNGRPVDFLDTRLKDEEDQPAAMTLFSVRLTPVVTGEQVPPMHDLESAFDYLRDGEATIKGDTGGDVAYYGGEELAQNSELLDQLWEICEDRFNEMGEMHPVSMEESKEFFVEMLKDPNVGAVVVYKDGRAVSFGFSTQDFDGCFWMTPQTRRELAQTAEQGNENHIYFTEIMSKRGEGQNFAADVVGLYCTLTSLTQRNYRLVFESSNMAATYVPPLVEAYINQTGRLKINDSIQAIDKSYYWAVSS